MKNRMMFNLGRNEVTAFIPEQTSRAKNGEVVTLGAPAGEYYFAGFRPKNGGDPVPGIIEERSGSLADVMDTAAPAKFENEVRALALRVPGVRALDKVRVRKSGLSHLVDIHVQVDGSLTVHEGHGIAHAVKDALIASAAHAISDVSVHIEPAKRPPGGGAT